jgi:hypothetical protein
MLIYVTGVSGTGKSAVCAELVARGYDARDGDDGISGWFRLADDVEVPSPGSETSLTPDWYAVHEWRYSVPRTAQLASELDGQVGFLCGCGANENEIWSLIDQPFYLNVDEETLRKRLATRTTNSFGKTENELRSILDWHSNMAKNCQRFGIEPLDATQPLDQVVDELLARCGLSKTAA